MPVRKKIRATTLANPEMSTDEALNVGFFVFHTSWIVFNCVGWLWRRSRRWHLATIAFTAVSWFGLGIHYGWGYCPCTDWHWQVRDRLGHRDPPSYMQLLITELTGLNLPAGWVDAGTGGVFGIVAVLSVVLNARDLRQRSHARQPRA
jgi:hypothetical protein